MEAFEKIVQSMPWYGWLGVVSILGGTVAGVVTASHRHRERMEMIRKGMDPDRRGR